MMVTPCRSGFRRALASWCGLWSMSVMLCAGTLCTMPCVQKPVPPPTSTTCAAQDTKTHVAQLASTTSELPSLALRDAESSLAGPRASSRMATVQCPGLTVRATGSVLVLRRLPREEVRPHQCGHTRC